MNHLLGAFYGLLIAGAVCTLMYWLTVWLGVMGVFILAMCTVGALVGGLYAAAR